MHSVNMCLSWISNQGVFWFHNKNNLKKLLLLKSPSITAQHQSPAHYRPTQPNTLLFTMFAGADSLNNAV